MISIIIPTWNRKQCVMNAINSILNQTTRLETQLDYEIIVIDDGSTDNIRALFKKEISNVKYIRYDENKGVNFARNKGVFYSRGDRIIFLDSDDTLTPDAFEIIKDYTKVTSAEVIFFGTAKKNGMKMYNLSHHGYFPYKDVLQGKKINGEFLGMYSRKVFDKYKFDESLFCFEAFFVYKVIKEYSVFTVDKICRLYSFEQKNRITNDLAKLKNADKRYKDYKKYIKTFGWDYLKYMLFIQFAKIVAKTVYYRYMLEVKRWQKKRK